MYIVNMVKFFVEDAHLRACSNLFKFLFQLGIDDIPATFELGKANATTPHTAFNLKNFIRLGSGAFVFFRVLGQVFHKVTFNIINVIDPAYICAVRVIPVGTQALPVCFKLLFPGPAFKFVGIVPETFPMPKFTISSVPGYITEVLLNAIPYVPDFIPGDRFRYNDMKMQVAVFLLFVPAGIVGNFPFTLKLVQEVLKQIAFKLLIGMYLFVGKGKGYKGKGSMLMLCYIAKIIECPGNFATCCRGDNTMM